MQIILGSSSIARRKILSEMGYEFTLMVIFIYLGNLSVTNLLEKRSFSSIVYVECRYWWEEYQKGEAGKFGHGSCWCKGSVFYLIVKSLFDMIVLIDRKILESQSNQCYISSICPCGCGCVYCLVLCFRMSKSDNEIIELLLLIWVWLTSQADSIISKLQNINNQEKDEIPTILIAADTVCLDFV